MSDHVQTPACPEKVVLRALLDGSLPAEQLAAVQAHADGCASCEAALKQMTVGGESWIGMAASLKERDEQTDGPLAAAMERLKTDDGSGDGDRDETDPQQTLDFLQPADDPKLLGKLGQHEITEVIGWGGMGVVLKAYDPSLHRVVAVKVLASHLAHHAVARKRFIREAQAAAAVCHDNVVTIHAIEDGVADASRIGLPTRDASATLPKIIMQFVAGGSLQERIDQDGPLELKEVLRIAMQTAAGLAAAHAQGVVHRDVKPANILLENGVQRVKLTDFGLARVMDDASLTLSGVIAGTPQYMAPEQAWGRDVDARADLFSLGAVMYAMCSGHSPFRARTTMAVLKRVCEDAPRPLRAINPDVPDWLVAIIEKLLAKNPDERFQTATEVSELLGKWLAHVQQPTVVAAPEFSARRESPDIAASPDRVARPDALRRTWKRDEKATPFDDSGRATRPTTISASWALLLVPVVLLLHAVVIWLEWSTAHYFNLKGDIAAAFIAFQMLLGFVQFAVFRWAWNSVTRVSFCVAMPVLALIGFGSFVVALSHLNMPDDTSMVLRWGLGFQTPTAIAYFAVLLYRAIPQVPKFLVTFEDEHRDRRESPDIAASPDWVARPEALRRAWKRDEKATPFDDSGRATPLGDPRTTNTTVRGQLPARFVVWPLIVMWVLLGVMFAVVMADSGMRNIEGFLGFSAIQLVATFVLASVFRSAWNSSSWLVWIGSLLFLPFVASLFVWGASYRDTAALTQWLNALQALSAMAYWLGLLFVRPLFVKESDSRRAAPVFQWGRALALSGLLLVPVSLWVVMQMRMSEVSRQRAYYEATEAARITMPADTMVAPQPRDPRRPQLDGRGFPKPEMLSNNRTPESSFEVDPSEPIAGMPPSSIGGSTAMAAAPDSLRPLLGRWVVLTLQGDEPPFASAAAGGAGAMMAAPVSSQSGSGVVTPSTADQLRSLEFRDGRVMFDDPQENQFNVEVRKDRELLLQDQSTGESVRHGVFTIADDRLVICWTSRNQPLPRGFQPKPHEQLVVCRREWPWPRSVDEKGNEAVEAFHANSKLPKAEMPFSSREAAELQRAWAQKSNSPVEVTNSIGMKLLVIPPGSFGEPRNVAAYGQSAGGMSASFGAPGGTMGGGEGNIGAGAGMMMGGGPRSGERGYAAINGPILVGADEVTVAQFRQFVEDSKYVTEAERSETGRPAKTHSWRKPEIEQDSDQHPVVHVTFEDALAFCHWLSEKEKKPYRLLTRREWEFCARAGSWLPATLGPGKLAHRSQFFTTTAPGGSYTANSFGLHDFIGNVAEWAWHSDVPERTDARRSAPNTMIWSTDPTVFCGGDFRQHINRSQPHEWLHPTATTTPPVIGFRVACDLTAESAVSVPKHWPMSQLFLSQELVLVRKLAASGEKNSVEKGTEDKSTDDKPAGEKPNAPTTQLDARLVNAVWLEMLVHAEQMPYAVEWLDFEIERRATPSNETPNDFVHGKIEEAGAEAGWKPLDLALTLRLLEQTEFVPDPIATPLQNHVLTMPIPKPVTGQWASPDARRGFPSSFVRLEPAIQKPQLFRFLDLNAPHGNHYYRVRLKYRVPVITPETVQTTGWFLSMNETSIDFDALDQRKLPENTPVIELKLKHKPQAAPASN